MTQEQVKALMDKMGFPAFNAWGYELMLKFYEAAQNDCLFTTKATELIEAYVKKRIGNPVCYRMEDEDGSFEYNGIDQFSGGRSGGTPLYEWKEMK